MSDRTYTALYRDWSDRKRPWVLIERTPSGFQHWKILAEIPSIGMAIVHVMENFDVDPAHWTEIDTDNHRARAIHLKEGAS